MLATCNLHSTREIKRSRLKRRQEVGGDGLVREMGPAEREPQKLLQGGKSELRLG